MAGDSILIIGLGEVGGKALEILARRTGIARIYGADFNETYGPHKVNNARFGADLEGLHPNIEFVKIDLKDVERTAETLARLKPAVIFNSTSLQSYWVIELLPKEIHRKFQQISYGPWIPMHLTLCYKLMQAVEESGIQTQVVNGAYPDAVNPTVGKVCQAPVAGIGNGELIIPQVKQVVARRFGVPMRSVECLLVQHHYTEYWIVREGHDGGAPSYLKVLVDGNDVTSQIDLKELWADVIVQAKRPGRPDGHYMVASSAVQKIMAIYHDTGELSSCIAGAGGMLGGYPGRLSRRGFDLVLPDGISLQEAIDLNARSSVLEGIEEIRDDGTVVFTEEKSGLMRELLHYDCKTLKITECESRAAELGRRYQEFASKYVTM